MELRPTSAADLPTLRDIFIESIRGVYEPHRFAPPAPPLDVFASQQRHVVEDDGAMCVVAERAGAPIGFAAAWTRGDTWFLASLFVRPSEQNGGVGSALLDAVWGDGDLRRHTITDAIQPVSNAVYARRGLIPVTPVLSLGGHARVTGDCDLTDAGSDGDEPELSALDQAAYGFDRSRDHAYWAAFARRTVWRRGDKAVAYSYVFPDGTIGPVAGVDGAASAAALTCELARAGGNVRVRVPGSSRALVAAALAARLRLGPTPGLLLLGPGIAPPTALAIGSYTLF
jgi:GNAT superfamily N-acetyltransferase